MEPKDRLKSVGAGHVAAEPGSGQMTVTTARRLPVALLGLRLSLALVFAVWSLDKFVNPDHGAAVFQAFYGLGAVPRALVYAAGAVQAVLVVAFALGIAKTWSYGAVLIMHAVTTAVSWKAYLGLENILFFSAWPMLAGLVALWLLRDEDRLLSLGRARSRTGLGGGGN
jgi:uncharacterized membrane protein YphA (DoxX/SURF4 family)